MGALRLFFVYGCELHPFFVGTPKNHVVFGVVRHMKTKNMTVGKPGALIFTFALPLIAGNLFQDLR